jgi:hypothetical protein
MAVALTEITGGELAIYGASRPSAVTLRRRRVRALLAVLLLAIALAWGAVRTAAALGGEPASVPERRPGPITYVVEPGDTIWSIARRLQPSGDVRDLVRSLVAANGGAEVDVGDRLVLP